jgi:hypothetical protein
VKIIKSSAENPLLRLEPWAVSDEYSKRQVGFCSQWSLDNICKSKLQQFLSKSEFYSMFLDPSLVLIPERLFGYELVDNSGINVILNSYDVSEYLKISPSGLEVCNIIN